MTPAERNRDPSDLRCHHVVHPLAKGAVDYLCTRPHYEDGWCKQHHPDVIAEKRRRHDELCKRQDEGNLLTVKNAILLLVKHGYQVSKVWRDE